ncbi:CvpA family protein [Teredinibacter haidensis]|uniref:CvpA family protein n=1 Tax=Teredinibacter haidensis TaxID=2731755 RepID=UPI000948A95D|nr:CvpA family protein [Teredinibacter haidensis]
MSWISLIFVAWIGVCAFRGFRRGFWLSLLALLGVIAAYATSLLWGAGLSQRLMTWGWPPLLAYCGGFTGIYLLAYLLVAELPRLLLAALFTKTSRLPWLGAFLGTCVGVVSGLLMVWAFSFVQASLQLSKAPVMADSPLTDRDKVVAIAAKAVGEASRMGALVAGVDPLQAEVLGKLAREPQKLMRNLQALGESDQLKQFLSSSESQRYMREGNLDGLIESPGFQGIINLPELADLRQFALAEVKSDGDDEAGLREADIFIASRMALAWQRVHAMRNDSRVQDIVKDEQVQQMIESRDIPGLLMNAKVQSLMGLVMAGEIATVEREPRLMMEKIPTAVNLDASVLYRWRDSEGRVRYSDEAPEGVDVDLIQY